MLRLLLLYTATQASVLVDAIGFISGSALQSSTSSGGVASRAMDGNTNTDWGGGSCTHTNGGGPGTEWWSAQLDFHSIVTKVTLHTRSSCCAERNTNLRIYVSPAQTQTAGTLFKASAQVRAAFVCPFKHPTSFH